RTRPLPPVGLGTAGTIEWTTPPPGLDQSTVPTGRVPAYTSTSADAAPAVIVMCPAANADRTGGSALDRLTTFGSPDVQVSPVRGCPLEFNAWIVRVSPTAMLTMLGVSVTALPPPDGGTVKLGALLQIPLFFTRTTPLTEAEATVAVI